MTTLRKSRMLARNYRIHSILKNQFPEKHIYSKITQKLRKNKKTMNMKMKKTMKMKKKMMKMKNAMKKKKMMMNKWKKKIK